MGVFSKKNLDKIKQEESSPKTHTILIVDDELDNRVTLSNILKDDYNILTAKDGMDALDVINTPAGKEVHLIICDQRMPRLTGVAFLEKSLDIIPDARRIILSGYTDVEAVIAAVNKAKIYEFMLKPVDHQQLRLAIQRALEAYDLKKKNADMLSELRQLNEDLEKKVQERTRDLEQSTQEVVQAHQQLIRQEKLASLGTLTAGVAHELKNPLNFINNFSSISLEIFDELKEAQETGELSREEELTLIEDIKLNIKTIQKHGTMADQIIKSMMDFAHGGTDQAKDVAIHPLLDEYVSLAYIGQKGKIKVPIKKEFAADLDHVFIIPHKIGRVCINLINNAMHAVLEKHLESTDAFEPGVVITTLNGDEHFEIRVRDNGKGISPEKRNQIFDPFFTTKPTGTGNAGLGLAICHDIIVREHRGTIQVNSEPGVFTEFIISIPKESQPQQ